MRIRRILLGVLPHLAALIVIAGCLKLASWQMDRAEFKQGLLTAWTDAEAVDLSRIGAETDERYLRVDSRGHFDTRRHILLDNQIRHGHAGVHVFTPFKPERSDRIWLVNRGWQPLPDRDAGPPAFDTDERTVSIRGRLSEPPRVGLQIGRAEPLDPDNWPNLMTYFDLERIRDVLGGNVQDRIILLDPDHPAHLTGDDWQPVVFGPERHRAYAFQWLSIGAVVLLIWLVLTVRSFRKS